MRKKKDELMSDGIQATRIITSSGDGLIDEKVTAATATNVLLQDGVSDKNKRIEAHSHDQTASESKSKEMTKKSTERKDEKMSPPQFTIFPASNVEVRQGHSIKLACRIEGQDSVMLVND